MACRWLTITQIGRDELLCHLHSTQNVSPPCYVLQRMLTVWKNFRSKKLNFLDVHSSSLRSWEIVGLEKFGQVRCSFCLGWSNVGHSWCGVVEMSCWIFALSRPRKLEYSITWKLDNVKTQWTQQVLSHRIMVFISRQMEESSRCCCKDT